MSTPTRPVNISGRRVTPSISSTPVGTPDLRALRAQYHGGTSPPNIPPRLNNSAQPTRGPSPSLIVPPSGSSPAPRISQYGTPDNDMVARELEALPDEEKAKVLRRHLVSKDDRSNRPGSSQRNISDPEISQGSDQQTSRKSSIRGLRSRREDTEPFPVPYQAPGADVTHDIYKWQSDQRRQAGRPRAATYAGVHSPPTDPAFEHIHEPGGFRRNYLLLRANEQGEQEPQMLNNFIDFLYLFGHFAGEDLEDDEDEEKEEDEEAACITGPSESFERDGELSASQLSERQPLLGSKISRSRSRSRRRRASLGPHGDATVTQAVLMLLKSFIGTGVLFLGKAFFNGGILFSTITIVFIALVSLYSFLLLVKTKFVVSGSFGDLGGKLYGPWMRYAILTSITISQIGFVAAYTIFVSENLQAFVMGITKCVKFIPVQYFILMQLIIFLPLALVRSITKLSSLALVADVFILFGLLYIFGSEFALIGKNGPAEVKLFNAKDFPLFIGTAVFSFEGIGLVIPITDAMREPRKFPKVLTCVMLFLTVLFGGAGVLSYLAFGSAVQTVVIVNLDSTSKFVQAVQFLYSLAILLSVPLQLFPAVRIMENGLFSSSGKGDTRVKWLKNIFRFFIVMTCTGISWAGATDLDKFVAFVGSFACVPLCFIYPAMLHYKACAHTRKQKLADIVLMIFGFAASAYTTVQTIRLMLAPAGGHPKFGHCDVPPL